MLTGWEAYVGVYPSGKKQLVKKYNPSSKISTYMPVREQDRTGNKRKRHVYQVNEEGMLLMDFEGWSDKKSTTS